MCASILGYNNCRILGIQIKIVRNRTHYNKNVPMTVWNSHWDGLRPYLLDQPDAANSFWTTVHHNMGIPLSIVGWESHMFVEIFWIVGIAEIFEMYEIVAVHLIPLTYLCLVPIAPTFYYKRKNF